MHPLCCMVREEGSKGRKIWGAPKPMYRPNLHTQCRSRTSMEESGSRLGRRCNSGRQQAASALRQVQVEGNTDVARSAPSFSKPNCVPTAAEMLSSRQDSSLAEFGRSFPPRILHPPRPPSSCSSSTTALVPLPPPPPFSLACHASGVSPIFSVAAPPLSMVSRRVLVSLLSGPLLLLVENLKQSLPSIHPVSLGAGSHLLPVPCTVANAPQYPPSLPLINRPSPPTRQHLVIPPSPFPQPLFDSDRSLITDTGGFNSYVALSSGARQGHLVCVCWWVWGVWWDGLVAGRAVSSKCGCRWGDEGRGGRRGCQHCQGARLVPGR